MVKMLQKYGNSHALIIDKAIMDATGIGPETPVSVTVQGDSVVIRAANVGVGPERVDQIMDQVEQQFGRALKKLSQ